MTLKQIFGKNLKYYRFTKGYTQEEFAEKANLNTSYVSELENGKYGPKFERVEQIASILDIEPYLLFLVTTETKKSLPKRVDMK